MKQSRKGPSLEGPESLLPEPRRSSRAHKAPKNDDFFMGTSHLEEVLGSNYYEEDYYPKRRRKNYRYDDSDDYSEGHPKARRNPQAHLNQVEVLLEWKRQPRLLPLTINGLPQNDINVPLQDLHKLEITQSIASTNLQAVAEEVEALFINIDWDKPGQTMKEFSQLKIESTKFMAKGLVFVWAPKEHISQLLTIMEKKDFIYVQNLEIIKLDFQKAIRHVETTKKMKIDQGIDDIWHIVKYLDNISPCDLIANEPSEYFNRSKQTLLMFKKNNNLKFELRHQRTCDVVFDMPVKLGQKCDIDMKGYIYNMIQTLLPDCLILHQNKQLEVGYKMIELWGDAEHPRRGWVTLAEK